MAPGGIEPATFALLARRSNQLSYGASLNDIDFLKWYAQAIPCSVMTVVTIYTKPIVDEQSHEMFN